MPAGEIGEGLREFVTRQGVVPEGDNGGGLARGDLIRPTKAALKFIHNDDPDDEEGPKFEATFEVRPLLGDTTRVSADRRLACSPRLHSKQSVCFPSGPCGD